MTPQEAYNKGLDIAENDAYDKMSKALDGIDDAPFNNPKMEELRQRILHPVSNSNFNSTVLTELLLGKPIDESSFTETDNKIIDFLKYLRTLPRKYPQSVRAMQLCKLFRNLEVDFINNDGKL
jgi:hypothetical protein